MIKKLILFMLFTTASCLAGQTTIYQTYIGTANTFETAYAQASRYKGSSMVVSSERSIIGGVRVVKIVTAQKVSTK